MVIPDGAMMAHVQFADFEALTGLMVIVVGSRAFGLIRQFLGRS
jgi:hypothetical protein